MVVKKMKVKEIRELTTEQIEAKIVEAKDEIFNLRMQQATGSLEKPSRIHELRKDVQGESRENFYERILAVMAQLGGGSAHVL